MQTIGYITMIINYADCHNDVLEPVAIEQPQISLVNGTETPQDPSVTAEGPIMGGITPCSRILNTEQEGCSVKPLTVIKKSLSIKTDSTVWLSSKFWGEVPYTETA